jgi:hypothetical protein
MVVASATPRRCLLAGAVQDQVRFGCFVLRLGASWESFGLLSGERFFLRGALGLPWPPLWAWALPALVGGRRRSLFVPFPVLILVST